MGKITGTLYKVNTTTGNAFFEVPTGPNQLLELKMLVAEYAAEGHVVTSVVEMCPFSKATPRVALMDAEYKRLYAEALESKQQSTSEEVGDSYKVEGLLEMLVHETSESETHYGARLHHGAEGTKILTIDAGGLKALVDYYATHPTDLGNKEDK